MGLIVRVVFIKKVQKWFEIYNFSSNNSHKTEDFTVRKKVINSKIFFQFLLYTVKYS